MSARRGTERFPMPVQAGRPPRLERVARQLQQEIAGMMVMEMKDPRVRLASVSEVRVSPDLRNARVKVSAVGADSERHAVVAALRHAEGYLRAQLGRRLENLKNVPRLRFELDESIAYSVRISSMLRDMRDTEESAPRHGDPDAGPSATTLEGAPVERPRPDGEKA